jgi:hypothetical protein
MNLLCLRAWIPHYSRTGPKHCRLFSNGKPFEREKESRKVTYQFQCKLEGHSGCWLWLSDRLPASRNHGERLELGNVVAVEAMDNNGSTDGTAEERQESHGDSDERT